MAGLLLLSGLGAAAQGLINNGASIVITNGSNIYINGATGHFTNQSGGVITNKTTGGTITLSGNWANNAANTVFSNDGATVVLNAATAQIIAGTNATAFYNFTASGASTKTFNTSSTVSRLVSVGDNTEVNANGNLTLLATASSNASVGPLLNGASVTNNTIVQSHFTGGSDTYRVFKGVSSPINDALVAGNKTFKQLQSKLIITGTGGTTNGFDKGNSVVPYTATVKMYNEAAALGSSQFTNLSSITQSTTPGWGFFLFYRGSRASGYDDSGTYATGAKIEAPHATPENVIVDYTGPINQGTVNANLSYTDNGDSDAFMGSNLVGNPYPSVIDWHAVRSASTSGGANIAPQVYVIKQDGSFATYDANTQLGTNGGTRYIMPGQAFYVKANAASQTLTFTEACKDPYPSSGTVMRFLSLPTSGSDLSLSTTMASPMASVSPIKKLRLNLQNSNSSQETLIAFMGGSDTKYNNFEDALYFGGNTVVFCSKSDDSKNLAINVLPEPAEPAEIKLNIGTSRPGKLALSFTDLSGLGGTQLFLEDTYLKKVENVTSSFVYDFEIDNKVRESYGANRLKLVFRPLVALPRFAAKKVYGGSQVAWSAVPNANNNMFIIERSADGSTFEAIGSLPKGAETQAEYTFLDSQPQTGLNYYRLKLVDADNKYSYSGTVSLDYALQADEPFFKVYPNPVKDVLNVLFRQKFEKAVLNFYDLNGRLLKSFGATDTNKTTCNLGDLTAGVYVLKVVDNQNKEIGTQKLIKE